MNLWWQPDNFPLWLVLLLAGWMSFVAWKATRAAPARRPVAAPPSPPQPGPAPNPAPATNE